MCLFLTTLAIGAGCASKHSSGADAAPSASSAEAVALPSGQPAGLDLSGPPKEGPRLAARNKYVVINEKPNEQSAKIGYFRLGGIVERDQDPISSANCKGGWFKIRPRGYACAGDQATTDLNDPVVRAASHQPDLSKALPFSYGFVRAVLPLYLKVPTKDEQLAAEFKLEEHLDWFKKEGDAANKQVVLGANDVFLDMMGLPHDDMKVAKLSTEMSQGELFGGSGDNDPIPEWLQGGRKIPNVSGFDVPAYATFADRARRHTGLSFVGAFRTAPDAFERQFGVTADLRLAPITKVKPDSGSPFHGVALDEKLNLPIAWVLERDAKRFKIEGDKVRAYKKPIAFRTVIKLTGNKKNLENRLYYETDDGKWMRATSLNVARAPDEMPAAAKKGEKWIDISIDQQTLVLWEGSHPVYATLASTGQDRMGDPKTTKSTVRGTFRIRAKHITTVMDSSEGLGSKKEKDPEYGKTKRRGEGAFILQDVPWVQYFKDSYAIHGAYWHDVFGLPRSHGCVNLSPIDAHRVFFWTTPSVPQGWHGVYVRGADEDGTVVYVHE
jgi:lipoprotein-anchoring transpeptidase ErfK/SrfK